MVYIKIYKKNSKLEMQLTAMYIFLAENTKLEGVRIALKINF